MNINKNIVENITKKGYKIYKDNDKKIINSFEKNPASSKIFSYFKKHPFYRIIYQMIYDEVPLVLDEILLELDDINLKKVFPNSPLKNLLCPNCNNVVAFYNPYIQKKPKRKIKCSFCHMEIRLNNCDEEDDWDLSYNQVYGFLKSFIDIELLDVRHFTMCMEHGAKDLDIIIKDDLYSLNKKELIDYISKFYCEECNKITEVDKTYIKNIKLSEIFDGGLWLEWYVKQLLLSNKNIDVENGVIITDVDGLNYEVDVIALLNNKIYCIECKAINPLKKIGISDMGYIEQWKQFSDEVIISTTSHINNRDKTILTRDSIKYLELFDIEKIKNIIK